MPPQHLTFLLILIKGYFIQQCVSNDYITYNPEDFHCGIDDKPPVDTNQVWKDDKFCYDIHGNMYIPGDQLTSCCDCIFYTCSLNTTNDCLLNYWEKRIDTSKCCVDCDATVYPAGEVMSTRYHTDTNCTLLETETCVKYSRRRAFISKQMIPTNCCLDAAGLQPLKSSYNDPSTCTISYCDTDSTRLQPFWNVNQLYETCDCCMYNGTMVPPGWSMPTSFFQNITCCDGEILETMSPDLSDCIIQNMTYLIDTSGSMGRSRIYWLPAALQMVDFMMATQVNPSSYTLMDYVTTVQVTSTHTNGVPFQTAIEDISGFSGGTELTFQGLYEALLLSACHNFIMVFTDEIGNDTNDLALKTAIINLRDITKSVIFFMIVGSLPMFEAVFQDIGYVFKIDVPSNELDIVLQNVTNIMINSDICKENCTHGGQVTTPPPNPRPPQNQPIPVLRRRLYYNNPPDYFTNRSKKEFVEGFGDKNKEFWIGLKELRDLTSSGNWSLEIEVANDSPDSYTGQYGKFKVEWSKNQKLYKLIIGDYRPTSNLVLNDCLTSSFFEYPQTSLCSVQHNAGWFFEATTSPPISKKSRLDTKALTYCGCSSLMGTFGATDETGVFWGTIPNITFAELRISPTTSPPPAQPVSI